MVLDISKLVLMLESLQSSQQQKKGFVLCTSYLFDKCLIDMFIIGMIFFWGFNIAVLLKFKFFECISH